ncbi:hypothetical protein A0H81_12256 [Grifola frondosa]|uniref:PWI domain-containing protein n=1 Tax=Grifola frondosa TaxID=5627 RepID=A0A1C7LUY3_GRIFR|nr:hypothetical protein A0H81_12256 [Grifola frondosa]
MADAGFFKGTSADQDRRFSDKELKLLKSMKFPPEFDKKVDMRKVNLSVIRPWVVNKVIELVGFEDEVVIEYAMTLLEDNQQPTLDPRKMQINLTGFLTKNAPVFMTALWNLLLEAQESPAGVPRTFVEQKKEEMRQSKAGDTRALEERDRRVRLDEIRQNERDARGGRGTAVGAPEEGVLAEANLIAAPYHDLPHPGLPLHLVADVLHRGRHLSARAAPARAPQALPDVSVLRLRPLPVAARARVVHSRHLVTASPPSPSTLSSPPVSIALPLSPTSASPSPFAVFLAAASAASRSSPA